MKRFYLLAGVAFLLLVQPLIAQDCTFFFPMEEGTIIELNHYNKKGKITGTTRQEIIDKQISAGAIQLTTKNTFFDEKGEELMSSELTMACKDGVFTFDMDQFLNDEMLAGIEDMEFSIEGDNLEFPSKMSVGDILKDGKISLIVEGMPMMNMTTTVHNRKVEAIENVTTEAGSFECYKISYDVLTDAMIDIRMKGIEWIARDVGAIRTETYNKNGKLTGYTELVKLEE